MDNNHVEGYKCFNKGLICNYNDLKMEENTLYEIKDDIKVKRNGFHFCLRLEDTLRYFGRIQEDKEICKIIALGNIDWEDDEYYGYYDIGSTNKIYIANKLTRKEIMEYVDNLIDTRFIRFIMGYKLTNKELEYFKNKYKLNDNVLNHLKYYQEEDKEVFHKYYARILKK